MTNSLIFCPFQRFKTVVQSFATPFCLNVSAFAYSCSPIRRRAEAILGIADDFFFMLKLFHLAIRPLHSEVDGVSGFFEQGNRSASV